MTFLRRFGQYPGNSVVTQIEGITIIDLIPAGAALGVGSGVACVVGEFVDMTYATAVSATGVVTTKPQPVEVFSDADILAKVGGFDETIGEFGKSCGNGFVEVRGHQFNRLVVVPVNLASSNGIRLWRDLPTNRSATDSTPITVVSPATVLAGREFKNGANRVRVAKRVTFTGGLDVAHAVDGAQASNTGPAATGVFTSASAGFVAAGVAKGDLLVLGVIGGAGVPGTYRILSVDSATQLTVERLDGATFTWAVVAALPYRVHSRAHADSGPSAALADVGGYVVPARPLDATVTAAALLTPSLIPPANAATSWDPLSGLTGAVMPGGGGGLAYTAAVQAPNAASAAGIDALYALAIDSLLADSPPASDDNITWAARKSSSIAVKLRTHAATQSGQGRGRVVVVSPALDQVSLTTVGGDAYPGVGANRSERTFYSWPGALTFVQEAIGFNVRGADGVLYSDGNLDVTGDSFLASVMSVLNPERNPGESSATTRRALQSVLGYQRAAPVLGIGEYTYMRQQGVCGLRVDRTAGPLFQSGVTTSLVSGEKNINRRRFADFVQDSLAEELGPFNKLPVDDNFIDGVLTQATSFLEGLLSPNDRRLSRIEDYRLDAKSGNTDDAKKAGIFVLNVQVKMLSTADFIVVPVAVGPGLSLT